MTLLQPRNDLLLRHDIRHYANRQHDTQHTDTHYKNTRHNYWLNHGTQYNWLHRDSQHERYKRSA